MIWFWSSLNPASASPYKTAPRWRHAWLLWATLLLLALAALNGCAPYESSYPRNNQAGGQAGGQASGQYNPLTTTGAVAAAEAQRPHTVQSAPISSPNLPPNLSAPMRPVKVGLLLPLSGPNAALGQALSNAAQQAVFDMAANKFDLAPRDTGDSEDTAAKAARDAIASGAQLLIGPLFAAQAPAVHAAASASNVPMITLSSDSSLAAPDLYVIGFAPEAQVERVVHFALSHGVKRFAALVPDTAYGSLTGHAFEAAVTAAGGEIVASETYSPGSHDSEDHIRALAAQKGSIDALFLPLAGDELKRVAGELSSAGFDPHVVHLLGTGQWDVAGLAQQVPFVTGGWYAASDPALRRNFTATYSATYGLDPPRIATLAYDATALAAVLAKRGARFDQAALTNPNGFAGLDGIFRLLPDGTVQRGLAVLEVTPTGPRMIGPGPVTFANYTD